MFHEGSEAGVEAASEMLDSNLDELQREIAHEGPYTTVVEGGFHSQALSDEDADFLTRLLTVYGVWGLNVVNWLNGNDESRRNIAAMIPLVSTTGNTWEEVLSRLDNGNEYPGFYMEYKRDNDIENTHMLFEEGYQ